MVSGDFARTSGDPGNREALSEGDFVLLLMPASSLYLLDKVA